ncbi:MAG: hypothetical protein J0I34_11015 [Pseudonocardia sp.]|uniref:hypothetical protein n=1 Tax=Pseudonocardia sp. TaxID=60912 RepID=UPI00086F6E7D|nr:hypothetical protein [Pseudonocardia sp.]MBN9109306.1 hypothetical protein [Pseudonocardia sp.]ODU10087.1 MAG: hypothetical protein ABS80_23345 [Pseudonocardia sp. SCN 72-51]
MSKARRVTVTSPQTAVVLTARRGGVSSPPPRLSATERDRAERLRRAQLRLALVGLAGLALLLVGLPILLDAVPELIRPRLFGLPVSWLAVAVLPYPALALLAWRQLRRAERLERADEPPE